jgi:NADH:ubiquinone oxidoreductase subunit 2 (subunit N)
VIALFYYARIAQVMWMQPVPDEDRTPIRVPPSLAGALAICCIVTLVFGVAPGIVGNLGDLAELATPL